MHFKVIGCFIMKLFRRCLLNGFVGDFNLPIRPRMPKLRGAMFNTKCFALRIKRMCFTRLQMLRQEFVSKLRTVVGQNVGDFEHTFCLKIA